LYVSVIHWQGLSTLMKAEWLSWINK
jgi:hypothetical protein